MPEYLEVYEIGSWLPERVYLDEVEPQFPMVLHNPQSVVDVGRGAPADRLPWWGVWASLWTAIGVVLAWIDYLT